MDGWLNLEGEDGSQCYRPDKEQVLLKVCGYAVLKAQIKRIIQN